MPININSRILLSVASIAAAAALVIGSTFAFFSDSETSSNNVFGAGTLDLVLCDSDENPDADCPVDEGPADSVTASFGGVGLAPGDTVDAGFVELRNTGSIAIAEVDLSGVATETLDVGGPGSIVDELNLTVATGSNSTCSADTSNITAAVEAQVGNGNGTLTLAELGSGATYDALPGIPIASSYFVCMSVTLDAGAGNEVQGDAAEIDLTFTAQQVI